MDANGTARPGGVVRKAPHRIGPRRHAISWISRRPVPWLCLADLVSLRIIWISRVAPFARADSRERCVPKEPIMNARSPWLNRFVLSFLLLIGSGTTACALGNRGLRATAYSPYGETVYSVAGSPLVSTSYFSPVDSYVYPTSLVYPTTAYVYPTAAYLYPTTLTSSSYAVSPTSYVVPTYYRATSALLARRYVASPVYSTAMTYYTPTYYTPTVMATGYYPTVIEAPLGTSTICNEAVPAISAPLAAPRSSGSVGNEQAPSSVVESVPSNVTPYENGGRNAPSAGDRRTAPEPAPAPAADDSPPLPAAPEETRSTSPPPTPLPSAPSEGGAVTPLPPRTGANEINPPVAPPASELGGPGAGSSPIRREAQKPVDLTRSRPQARFNRDHILEGKVISSETKQGEDGVRVIVSSRPGNFVDRVVTTDAFGRYAVKLPDGDWSVKVAMPSGRVYEVSQITISAGQITDSLGRDVPSLTITR
jgi:hypothetical protein